MRVFGASFRIGATFGADADSRMGNLDRCKERLFDANLASHDLGVKTDAFLQVAARDADVMNLSNLGGPCDSTV